MVKRSPRLRFFEVFGVVGQFLSLVLQPLPQLLHVAVQLRQRFLQKSITLNSSAAISATIVCDSTAARLAPRLSLSLRSPANIRTATALRTALQSPVHAVTGRN